MKSTLVRSSSPLSMLTGLSVVLALGGCAHSPDTRPNSSAGAASFPWPVKPSMQVRHGMPPGQTEYLHGRSLDRQGAWTKSEQAYRRAIAADPGHVEAHNALGVALARQGRLQEARTVLQAAVNLDPGRAHLHSNLGQVLLRAGQAHDALASLQHAQQLDPLDPVSRGLLNEARTLAAALPGPTDEGVLSAENGSPPAEASIETAARTLPDSGRSLTMRQSPVAHVSAPPPITRIQMAGPLATAGALKLEKLPQPTAPKLEVADPVMSAFAAGPASPVAGPRAPEEAARHARLEIVNGNGVTGAAARLASVLQREGYRRGRLTNLRPYTTVRTLVQYREGYEAQAQAIARQLPVTPLIARETRLQSKVDADVRVVIGRDAVDLDRAHLARKSDPGRADTL